MDSEKSDRFATPGEICADMSDRFATTGETCADIEPRSGGVDIAFVDVCGPGDRS
jgi:hypothetical protein